MYRPSMYPGMLWEVRKIIYCENYIINVALKMRKCWQKMKRVNAGELLSTIFKVQFHILYEENLSQYK